MFTVRSGSSAGRPRVLHEASRNLEAVRREQQASQRICWVPEYLPEGRGLSCFSPHPYPVQAQFSFYSFCSYIPAVAALSPHVQYPLSPGPPPEPAVLLVPLLLQYKRKERVVRGVLELLGVWS